MHTSTRRAADRRSAFTLIELLIVVTIVGALVALLLPALGRVMAYAENIQCQANLKQIATAVLSYTTDHRGSIPPTECEKSGLFWCNILAQRDVPAQNSADLPEQEKSVQNTVLLCPASSNLRVYDTDTWVTPDDPKAQGWFRVGRSSGANRLMTDCSYFWNGYTGTMQAKKDRFPSLKVDEGAANPASQFHDIAEIQKRSAMVMVADGVFWNGVDQPQRIAARHTGSLGERFLTNMAFYDGHVEGFDRYAEGSMPDRLWSKEMMADDVDIPEGSEHSGLKPIMTRSPNLEGGPPYFMLPKR